MPVLRVTGTSMTPTLQNDQVIICNKLAECQKGDVVAFYYNNKVLIKRVIGVAGDVIDISGDGVVSVNGEPLDEPYVSELALGECDIELPYQVPDNTDLCHGRPPLCLDRQPLDFRGLCRN